MKRNIAAELAELTHQMADTDPDTDAFGTMLERRGELMHELCAAGFDPDDHRITKIERDGAELESIVQSRCTLLRDEMTVLARAARILGGVGSTLAPIEHSVLDVTA